MILKTGRPLYTFLIYFLRKKQHTKTTIVVIAGTIIFIYSLFPILLYNSSDTQKRVPRHLRYTFSYIYYILLTLYQRDVPAMT